MLAEPLRRVMLLDDDGGGFADALSRLEPRVATRHLIAMGGSRLSLEQLGVVALRVRPSAWVGRILGQASSGKWWKRMEAARLLAMVGGAGDRRILNRLVTDPHPAVASAATAAIAGRADAALVAAVAKGLPSQAPAVRHQQSVALKSHSEVATRVVTALLARRTRPSRELRAWIALAETLGTPAALLAVVPLTSHPDAEVRTSAARALRSCFFPEAVEAAIRLLQDEDWRVRAAAARAVGSLNAVSAIPILSEAMRDKSWWVRFRAALALADLHDDGRRALGAARTSDDPYARDMATLVFSLSTGARLELTSA